jgi:protein-tyrosine kinase
MERIKQALEKARQAREATQGVITMTTPPAKAEKIDYTRTRTVSVPASVLRQNRIITALEHSAFTDAYKILRTQVLQRLKENSWNVLAVTSPGHDEGKTLTAINLAISISMEVEYTVLLVDANLGHPWMHEHLGLQQDRGLSDYLLDDVPLAELLIQPARAEHLVLLPGGRPHANSAELLNSPRMTQLVAEMKSRYSKRIIIFDLPPVLTSADALAFAPYMDAVLLVVEEGKTRKQDVVRAVDLLECTNVLGTLLNKAPMPKS